MNRQITGWLAWGALALIVGVPGSEIIFSRTDGANAVAVAGDAPGRAVYGPAPDGPAKAGQTGAPATRAVRPVGGDPALVMASAIRESQAPAAPAETGVAAPMYKPIPIEFRTGGGEAVKVAALPEVAPAPMPASLRPAEPDRTLVARAGSRFEDDVRESIANIRGSRANADSDFIEDFRWGDDPRFRRNGRMLESFDSGDFSEDDYAGDSEFYGAWAAEQEDQPVLVLPRRGFGAGLPARRGNGIRMDLLLQ